MPKSRAFTLIELLVVIAIIAILAAVLFPVFASAKGMAYQYRASSSIRQINQAGLMYVADNEETYMPAMYVDGSGSQAWFGRKEGTAFFDPTQGLLRSYEGKAFLSDPIAKSKEYLGDHSGFGYNWGFLGSDFHITKEYWHFPQCWNPAKSSDLQNPSFTVAFATSAFYSPTWSGGDGQTYDFGFIDPVGYRLDNPNVDFRHIKASVVDVPFRRVHSEGNAVVALADGRAQTYKVGQLKDSMFERGPAPVNP